ncbi:hypothetical protein CIPAW_13G083200 [Carya illinoinensis]|uniref:Uncharacterized protein n=1 Tax=Carya illinoinensis TaxID=32201 RepID=A0A8T1NR19_CARIL|nr:hypothetical protein CIPAW_13G083200 [Carya illinoinensis]
MEKNAYAQVNSMNKANSLDITFVLSSGSSSCMLPCNDTHTRNSNFRSNILCREAHHLPNTHNVQPNGHFEILYALSINPLHWKAGLSLVVRTATFQTINLFASEGNHEIYTSSNF